MITVSYPFDPNAPSGGTVDRPAKLNDHTFGPILKEVHWPAGGWAVLTMTDIPGITQVRVESPADIFVDLRYNPGDTVTVDDLKDSYVTHLSNNHDEGPWRAENAFDVLEVDVWGRDTTGSPELESLRTSGMMQTGRPPDLEVIDGMAHFIKDIVTQPDGHRVQFYGHYVIEGPNWYATTDGYGNPNTDPDPIVSYIGGTELLWYHKNHIPPVDYEKIKSSWIINFTSGKTQTVSIYTGLVCEFTLRTYSNAAKFIVNADGTVTVQDATGAPAVVKLEQSGSAETMGPFLYFTSGGFIPSP